VHGRLDNFTYPEKLIPYLPASFREQGYRTAMLGKFYEGPAVEKAVQDSAYDLWFKNVGPDHSKFEGERGTREYAKFREAHLYYDQAYEVGDETKVVTGHQTDVLFEQAANFAKGDSDQPFMIFLSPFAPHAPFNPSKRRTGKYAGKGIPPRGNQEFGMGYMTPAWVEKFGAIHERTCEMIEDIDEGVGRIFLTLEKTGQLDNTIIIFTSDNGVVHGEHGFGWKRHPWQEAIKVPLLIRYPKAVKPGTVVDADVSLTDLFPTCADFAGVALPTDDLRYGKSIVPLLAEKQKQIRDTTLIMQYEEGIKGQDGHLPELAWISLITSKGWKLIRYRVGPPDNMRPDYGKTFLFNLNDDPLEKKNLAQNPEYASVLGTVNTRLIAELKGNQEESAWLRSNT
jgi:N-acetylglucosamine-6-sulfatase